MLIKRSVFLCLLFFVKSASGQQTFNKEQFTTGLDSIRQQLKIPGMAVAVQQGSK